MHDKKKKKKKKTDKEFRHRHHSISTLWQSFNCVNARRCDSPTKLCFFILHWTVLFCIFMHKGKKQPPEEMANPPTEGSMDLSKLKPKLDLSSLYALY